MRSPNSRRSITSARSADCGESKPSACGFSTPMDQVNTCRPPIRPLCRIIFGRPCAAGHWSRTAMEARPAITSMWTMWSARWSPHPLRRISMDWSSTLARARRPRIKDLIRVVLDVTDSNAKVVYNAQTSGGVSRMKADLNLAKEKLRFQPSIKLEEGLRLTLQRDPRFK